MEWEGENESLIQSGAFAYYTAKLLGAHKLASLFQTVGSRCFCDRWLTLKINTVWEFSAGDISMNISKLNWNGQNHTFSARVCSFISSSAAIRHLTPGFPLSWLLCGPQSLSAHLAERLLGDYQEKLDATKVRISCPLFMLFSHFVPRVLLLIILLLV